MFWRRGRDRKRRGEVTGPEMRRELRSMALGLDAAAIRVAPTADLPRLFGLITDMGYPEGSATIVALADTTTSMYTSGGGGIIGGGEHEPVAPANRRLLQVVEARLELFAPSDATDVPGAGRVRMTALTHAGRLVVEAPEDDLGNRRHPAAPVFHAVHDGITALREGEERARSASS
ncbi:MAG TPA: hypothetical protein VIC57_11325 [Candidatus Dormibacteraeota bacterium]|jgi:hypothetical protein